MNLDRSDSTSCFFLAAGARGMTETQVGLILAPSAVYGATSAHT